MLEKYPGEFYALMTAIFWTFTALAFTEAGKRIGSLAVNFWRLIVGIVLLSVFVTIVYKDPFPDTVSGYGAFWLAMSGFVGIFLGDLFLFKAFTVTGPRVALLIMSMSPPLAALISWLSLGEILSWKGVLGMVITMTGIILVILKSNKTGEGKKLALRYNPRGILYAILGAIGQASGLVMSKIGMEGNHNAFSATQIRVLAGILGFVLLITYMKRWKPVISSVKNVKAFGILSIGAFFGPFLGISFSLLAVSYANPGVVQTITSINPILIIPFSVWFFKEKIGWREIIGATIAVAGVSLFFV
ncbi:MAG: EamA family transporter [Bacteroidetes bacterium HGW-Bacteroidetes-21]|jgi:drug/metabolite transporter (DMT)-like permease|nr:MAG: EamA family transporter [Bacteroidetes bacterium HGW-Bacteroidetes-21]